MEVLIVETPDEVARASAARIAQAIRRRREPGGSVTIGVATGSSPLGTYRELAALVRAGELDFGGIDAFALDEYVGLAADHPESYHEVIRRVVTEPLGLDPARVRIPDGLADDLDAGCAAYEAAIEAAGGIDIQLLGIGGNGHIGFNEPGSPLASRTRVTVLAPATRADNARFFGTVEQVPTRSVTQGVGTILDAEELLLVAQGASKARAVAQMIEGPVSSRCPASALQLHPRAVVVIDRAAAAELSFA
ncbi:glucosamine-6-phosphate deaminase, partial [Leucobacter soli]